MQFHKQISKSGGHTNIVWSFGETEMIMFEKCSARSRIGWRRRMAGPTLFVELVSNKFLRLSISSTPGLARQS